MQQLQNHCRRPLLRSTGGEKFDRPLGARPCCTGDKAGRWGLRVSAIEGALEQRRKCQELPSFPTSNEDNKNEGILERAVCSVAQVNLDFCGGPRLQAFMVIVETVLNVRGLSRSWNRDTDVASDGAVIVIARQRVGSNYNKWRTSGPIEDGTWGK